MANSKSWMSSRAAPSGHFDKKDGFMFDSGSELSSPEVYSGPCQTS